jgi:hypothetical protein
MKTQTRITLFLFSAMLILPSMNVNAATFEESMGSSLQKFAMAASADELFEVADQFERIGNAEIGQWLPFYYASLSCVNVVMRSSDIEKNTKGKAMERAQTLLDKSMRINPDESEIFALQALIYQLSISNPMDGATLSMKAASALEKAEKLNAQNPRVHYLKGTNAFHTPKAFGGGAENAKPMFEKAKILFDSQQNLHSILPNWGKEHNKYMLNECSKP